MRFIHSSIHLRLLELRLFFPQTVVIDLSIVGSTYLTKGIPEWKWGKRWKLCMNGIKFSLIVLVTLTTEEWTFVQGIFL